MKLLKLTMELCVYIAREVWNYIMGQIIVFFLLLVIAMLGGQPWIEYLATILKATLGQ
jgi:hypothetical protein